MFFHSHTIFNESCDEKFSEIFDLKNFHGFFENAQTFCFREEFFQIQKQNVRNDLIITVVDYFCIRITRSAGNRREPPPPSGNQNSEAMGF